MPYRPTEKTEARKKAQHRLLLTTALEIVAKDGFQNLTIACLAEQAQVAIGTVYKYFESKALLCAEVFRLATEKEVARVQQAAFPEAQFPSCEQRLADAINTFSERALLGHNLAYALIAEPVEEMVQVERLKYREAYADIFEALINEGIQKKEFCQQDARVSAAALVGTLAETLLGSIVLDRKAIKQINQQEVIQEIRNFCLRAVKS
jgi:AcrR family transcriptional regulator